MNPERIEKGDIVNITLTGSWIPKAEVLCVPNGDGVWGVKNSATGQIIYIRSFETMCLMSKKVAESQPVLSRQTFREAKSAEGI